MHHGIVAAAVPAEPLILALDAQFPTLVVGTHRGPIDSIDLTSSDDGWRMAFGERDGRSYLFDTSTVLSAGADAVVGVSRDLSAVVVGCGAESTSGSCRRQRSPAACARTSYSDMRDPWSKGEPLPSEATQPFEDVDGVGLFAALAGLGFDFEAWLSGDELRDLLFTYSEPDPEGPRAAREGTGRLPSIGADSGARSTEAGGRPS